ncbi:MAG: prepilin-type N-terminal cleavage/methylation domain-containing protein [Geobacteraceae bacterium]|nr:prepilin-type N-terminal cleavage/methylation domain-containing protein [Geobacteraceae bacterium]NTW79934.1 prepilin-type N-terminal cleavage/methylation domain-containing protein [Geobacteraceae bacterium]
MARRWRLSAIFRNKGFTLLEILIAVVLLGILSAALYGSYFGVLRARERASSGMESRRELGATLDLLRREVSSAIFNRSDKRLRFVVEDRDNFGVPSSTLEMTTLAPPAGDSRSESGIVVVTYRMAGKNKRFTLTRQERDLFSEESVIPAYPQMEQINAFLVECYDGSKWIKSWDTAINGALPKGVRVTVQIEEEGKPVQFTVLSTPRVTAQ